MKKESGKTMNNKEQNKIKPEELSGLILSNPNEFEVNFETGRVKLSGLCVNKNSAPKTDAESSKWTISEDGFWVRDEVRTDYKALTFSKKP